MYIIVKIDNILNDLPDYIVRQIVFLLGDRYISKHKKILFFVKIQKYFIDYALFA